ncbi:MAG: alpha/beta hydrolase [Thermoleophilia bacterium]|nr:alpha/beta hydrolase [Thermoleophilia bacterium]
MAVDGFTIRVDGDEIGGWDAGDGPAALILHGGPGLSDYTEGLAAELAGLFRTIRYQQRGLPPTRVSGSATVEDHVADAVAVLDGLGIERAWVVGHSWGGHLAMHLAVAAPERLLGAIVIDPLGAVPDGGEAELGTNLTSRLTPETAVRVDEMDARLLEGQGTEADGAEMMRLVWPYYYARPESAPPMPPMRMNNDVYAETFASIRQHFERGTLVRGLPQSDLRLLFIHGRNSPIPWQRSQESADLARNAQLEVIDNCGHFPWLEQPGSIS